MTVTAALIVKDGAATLERCLRSIRDGVDEIVVVDTGSRDQTPAIARRYADRVHDFPWCHDFAAARQYAFARATGEWVCWLDADDVVSNGDQIGRRLREARPAVHGFYWKYLYSRDEYGNSTCELWRERCVRNDGTFQWIGPAHEVLVPARPVALERDEAIVIVHHPERARGERDPARNLAILQWEYARQGDPEPRLLLYLGNEYADLGQFDLALPMLRRYVRVSSWDEEKYLAQVKIAALLRATGAYRDALDAAHGAIAILPRWPHAYFSLVETYSFLRDWGRVIHWADYARRLPIPDTICPVDPMALRHNWLIHYTNALYHTGRVQDALAWTRTALEHRPGEPFHTANLRFLSGLTPLAPPAGEETT